VPPAVRHRAGFPAIFRLQLRLWLERKTPPSARSKALQQGANADTPLPEARATLLGQLEGREAQENQDCTGTDCQTPAESNERLSKQNLVLSAITFVHQKKLYPVECYLTVDFCNISLIMSLSSED